MYTIYFFNSLELTDKFMLLQIFVGNKCLFGYMLWYERYKRLQLVFNRL